MICTLKYLILLICFGLTTACFAQNATDGLYEKSHAKTGQALADSLLHELETNKQINRNDTNKVNLLSRIAKAYDGINSDEMMRYSSEALAIAKKIKYCKGMAVAYNLMGNIDEDHNNYDTALKYYTEAKQLYEGINNVYGIAVSSNNIGNINMELGNFAEAEKHFREALKLYERIENKLGMANAYNNIGNILELQSNYPEALKQYSLARKLYEEMGDKKGNADTYNNIGNVYADFGNYPDAIRSYFNALKIYEVLFNKQLVAHTYVNISSIYITQKDYASSLENVYAALKIFQETNDKEGIACCYDVMGINYEKTGNFTKALESALKSLKIYTEIGDKNRYAVVYNNIGSIYNAQGDYKESIKNYFVALIIEKELGNKAEIANTCSNLSYAYLALHDFPSAHRYIDTGLSVAIETGNTEKIRDAYQCMSAYDSATGNWKDAYNNTKLYNVYRDSFLNTENTKKITQLQMQYDFDKREDQTKAEQDRKDAIARQKLLHERNTRYGTIAIASLLLGMSGIIFYNYSKRRKLLFQKQVAETEMTALRAQMNPHFIFNALNSINTFIQENNNSVASQYLLKFSALIRVVLENSLHQSISLAEEIAALERYLSLEKLRLGQKLDYEFIIAEDIDKDNVLIPPLILQPFIENAILHGLQHKDGGGKVRIQISKQDDRLVCSIADNGIGRKRAAEITGRTYGGEKQSLGMKLTEQRIAILNETSKVKAYIQIVDLPNDGAESGVKVELVLPLMEKF